MKAGTTKETPFTMLERTGVELTEMIAKMRHYALLSWANAESRDMRDAVLLDMQRLLVEAETSAEDVVFLADACRKHFALHPDDAPTFSDVIRASDEAEQTAVAS